MSIPTSLRNHSVRPLLIAANLVSGNGLSPHSWGTGRSSIFWRGNCNETGGLSLPIAFIALANRNYSRRNEMKNFVVKSITRLHQDEAGQGLVEYLLILALVAFAATAGMGKLASGLNSAFTQISTTLGTYIT